MNTKHKTQNTKGRGMKGLLSPRLISTTDSHGHCVALFINSSIVSVSLVRAHEFEHARVTTAFTAAASSASAAAAAPIVVAL